MITGISIAVLLITVCAAACHVAYYWASKKEIGKAMQEWIDEIDKEERRKKQEEEDR